MACIAWALIDSHAQRKRETADKLLWINLFIEASKHLLFHFILTLWACLFPFIIMAHNGWKEKECWGHQWNHILWNNFLHQLMTPILALLFFFILPRLEISCEEEIISFIRCDIAFFFSFHLCADNIPFICLLARTPFLLICQETKGMSAHDEREERISYSKKIPIQSLASLFSFLLCQWLIRLEFFFERKWFSGHVGLIIVFLLFLYIEPNIMTAWTNSTSISLPHELSF